MLLVIRVTLEWVRVRRRACILVLEAQGPASCRRCRFAGGVGGGVGGGAARCRSTVKARGLIMLLVISFRDCRNCLMVRWALGLQILLMVRPVFYCIKVRRIRRILGFCRQGRASISR